MNTRWCGLKLYTDRLCSYMCVHVCVCVCVCVCYGNRVKNLEKSSLKPSLFWLLWQPSEKSSPMKLQRLGLWYIFRLEPMLNYVQLRSEQPQTQSSRCLDHGPRAAIGKVCSPKLRRQNPNYAQLRLAMVNYSQLRSTAFIIHYG